MNRRQELADLLIHYPDLNQYGWTIDEHYKDGKLMASSLSGESALEEVDTALQYIAKFGIPKNVGSYGLKHDAERYGSEIGMRSYVSNGAFIAAALLSGYTAVRFKGSPNSRFRKQGIK